MPRPLVKALLAALALGAALARPVHATPEEGDTPPPLEIRDWVNGGPVDLAKTQGKVVAVLFFSLDSPEIDHYFEKLNNVVKAYEKSGLVFVGVTRDSKPAVEDRGMALHPVFPIGCDDDQKTWKSYAIRSFPWAFVINIYGEVSWVGEGFEIGAFVPAIEVALKDIKGITVKREDTGPKFEKVWKAIDKADFKTAIKLLETLSHSDTESDRTPGEQLLKDIGVIADQRLGRAGELAKRRDFQPAEKIYKLLQKEFEGLPQAKAAKDALDKLLKDPTAKNEIEAMNAFLAAKAMEDGHDQTHAVEQYQTICSNAKWRGTKGQVRAQERLDDIKNKRKKKP
jgi:peroxiredoxin